MGRKTVLTLGVLAAICVGAYFKDDVEKFLDGINVKLPEYQATKKTVWLDQKISKEKLGWFYHADQGTRTFGIPYEWFVALERPTLSLTFTGLFSDTGYMDRFGFIPDTVESNKPQTLPIGFARGGPMPDGSGDPWRNPRTRQDMTAIGLTCAACHTGRFTYQNTTVVIDGGPALTNLYKLKQGLGVSLLFTRYLPFRFGRFAERILGPDASSDDRAGLKEQLDLVLKQYKEMKDLEDSVAALSIDEGFGRLDALNRIGNQVFSVDLKNPKNYAAHSAPVHYPRIWNAPWFDWVQYNGSIEQPMVRNAGESLGVSSDLNLTDESKGLYKSSVKVETLYEMERMIAGDPPSVAKGFTGLKSPEWPKDILPPINEKLAADGEKLYVSRCQGCHLPPVTSQALFENPKWWIPNKNGEPRLKLELIPLEHIGTDPAQTVDMANRTVALPSNLGIKRYDFGHALGDLVENTINYWYNHNAPPTPQADRDRINGYTDNGIQAPLAYRVRPLNGVWATPPYLHNGSVPTIDDLLGPADKRPPSFYLGNREYDPVKLGYKTEPLVNGFEFKTWLRGNSNRGHEFSNTKGPGVIGTALSTDERKSIIEYLKTL